jgi:hypothetical protein
MGDLGVSEEPVKVQTPYFISISATDSEGRAGEVSIRQVPGAVYYAEYASGKRPPWWRRILRRR